jgi:N-acyl-D-amino-acid deacylase
MRRLHAILFLAVLAIPRCGTLAGSPPGAIAPEAPAALPVTGPANPDLAPLDRLMSEFVMDHEVPGAALAVAKNGELVYARGFGYADVEGKIPVQPASLFRIASLSKPITAVAVLQLVEAGKLKLDDPVFAVLKDFPSTQEETAGRPPVAPTKATADPRLGRITVRQLLQHTGGWDSAKSGEPMFRSVAIAEALGVPPPALPPDIIRYMRGRPLDFDPGERCASSNFGYCVLGRIIEKASGQTYEDYVRTRVLAPLGIRTMRLGKTLLKDRAPGEVRYYDEKGRTGPCVFAGMAGEKVPLPYGTWCLEAMDAHGGWLAPAADLVRFASAFGDPAACPVLKAEGIRTMFACPDGPAGHEPDGKPKAAYYACGWMVRPVGKEGRFNAWHAGGFDGASTLLVRRCDGFAWAVLFNCRNGNLKGKDLAAEIDPLVHRAVDAVKDWPRAGISPR